MTEKPERYPFPFEFLNHATKEYIDWYVWAFEKIYGKGSWKKTLAEKCKEQENETSGNGQHENNKKNGDHDEWRKR